MKNAWYQPSIEEHSDEPYELNRKVKSNKSLNFMNWNSKKYQKAVFSIPCRASIYNHIPVSLDVKNKTGRDLIDISKHKIKMYTIDRRTRSGQ